MGEIEPRFSRRTLLKAAAAIPAGVGLSIITDRIIMPAANAQTLQNRALTEPVSTEQHEDLVLPKFRCVMAWGQYRGERKSELGFDTQGAKASGTVNTWDGKNPVSFTDKDRISATVDWTDIDMRLDGEYNTHIVGYWNEKVSPESGLTFYCEIDPKSPPEERYTVHVLNTSGKEPRIYFQSRYIGKNTNYYNVFRGKSADVEIRTTDKDGRWNTVGGLFLGQNKDIAEAFKAKHAQYSQ